MYKVIMQYSDERPHVFHEFETLKEAEECLNRITQTAEKDHCIITKTDKYKYTIQDNLALTFDEVWIEKDDKNKSQNNQQLTLMFNNQNQTTMAKTKSKGTQGTAKAAGGQRVIGYTQSGSPVYSKYKTTPYFMAGASKHGKDMILVPVQFVTLPSPFYTHARKYLKTGSFAGKVQTATYVIGCTFTKNNKKLYIVARLSYMGGKPAIAQAHYRGYSKRDAWRIFSSLPYHEMRMNDKNGKEVRVKSDGSYDAVNEERRARNAQFQQNRYNGDASGARLR